MSNVELPPKRLRWYFLVESKVYGPFDRAAIAGMITRNQLLDSDKVHIEGGAEWIAAGQDAHLASLFRNSPTAPTVGKARQSRRWVSLALRTCLLISVAWLAWPYYALFSLMAAVREGDVPTLERRVDWNSVRQGLRGDINVQLLKAMSDKSKGNSDDALATGFATLFGPAVINNLIDGYVTPQAVAAASRNEKSLSSSESPSAVNNFNNVKDIDWDKIKYAFFSGPFSFRVDVLADKVANSPVSLELHWKGDWQLVRVVLPSDAFDAQSKKESGSSRTPAASYDGYDEAARKSLKALLDSGPKRNEPSPTKTTEPPLVELTLLSKRFREADFRATPLVRAVITLELSVVNKTNKTIRAFDGVIVFTDLLDNELLSTKLAINDSLVANAALKWSGGIDYNEFIKSHNLLRNESMENIKIKFTPRKVLYADGSTKQFD